MGGMYALQMTDYPRICVNPALHMSQVQDVLQAGTFERFQPTADGQTHFTITKEIIEHFKEMEQHLFDGITSENQSLCWGFFANGESLRSNQSSNPLLVSWLILLAPVVEPLQENDSCGAEQFVPDRDVSNNRRRPAHGYHQHTCHNMNRYHKNLVLVHNLKNH